MQNRAQFLQRLENAMNNKGTRHIYEKLMLKLVKMGTKLPDSEFLADLLISLETASNTIHNSDPNHNDAECQLLDYILAGTTTLLCLALAKEKM